MNLTHLFTDCRKTNFDRNELGIITEHDSIANKSNETEIAGEDAKALQHGLLADGEAYINTFKYASCKAVLRRHRVLLCIMF